MSVGGRQSLGGRIEKNLRVKRSGEKLSVNVQIHLGQRSERRECPGTEGGGRDVTVNNGGERASAHAGVGPRVVSTSPDSVL